MDEFEQLLMLIGLEGFALSIIVLVVIFIVWRRRQAAIRAALADFVHNMKKFATDFESRVQQQLIESHALSEAEAKKDAHHMAHLFLLLGQSYIDSMRTQNTKEMRKFFANLQTLAKSSQQAIKQPESNAAPEPDTAQLEEKIQELKHLELMLESKDKELIMTQKTLEQIMSEYSSMYTGSKDEHMEVDEIFDKAHINKDKLAVEAESEIHKRKTATQQAVDIPETPTDQ